MASVSETLQSALTFHQTDDLPRAENLYRQILRIDPKQADALHLLGLAAFQQGRNESALDLINRAIAVNARTALYHNNLGTVSRSLGRIDPATECFRTAIELSPEYADAHYNLGTLLKEQGQLEQALKSFREALRINPHYAEAHNNLGTVLKDLGRIDEAVECYRRALELDPDSPQAHNNLETALQEQENRDGASQSRRSAIALTPDVTEAHVNPANTYRDQDRLNEAFASSQQALDIETDHAGALCNNGRVQRDLGKPGDAISTASFVSEETLERPQQSTIVDSAGELSQSDDSCQPIENVSQAQKTELERAGAELQWLIENRGLRLDAHQPLFAETRREFHLSRYQFATQYCEEKRVLDAACGTGYGSALLAESAIEVHGIDACPRTIDYAQRNYGNGHLKFHKSRVEWITFDEGYFDVVVSFETIEHTISPRWVMQEFARVLRADGTAVLSIPNSWGLTPHHFVDFDLPQLRELTEHFFEEQQYFYNNSGDRADCTLLGIGPLDDIDPKQAECILAVCRRPRKEHLGEHRLESLLDDLYEQTVQRHQESLFSRKRSFPIQTIETKSLENVSKVRCGDMLILDAKRAGDQQGRVLLEIETDVEKWKADSVRINLPHIDLDNALPARLHIVRSDGTHVNSRSVQLVPKSSLRKC